MNPETFIPFTVGDYPACTDGGRTYVVTLRIFNALAQFTATPMVQKGGRPLEKLQLTCGAYTAYWDGFYAKTRQKAASGIYPYILEVDGHKFQRRLQVSK